MSSVVKCILCILSTDGILKSPPKLVNQSEGNAFPDFILCFANAL